MIFVFGPGMFEMNQGKGASPYGAGTYGVGDGSQWSVRREPTKYEFEQAFHQGHYIANITRKLKEAA